MMTPMFTNKHDRKVWPTQVGSFLVSIGLLSGFANMAFFPSAICQQGMAGNFVVVYIICVIFIGFPITYLHLTLGQYSGCNPMNVFGKLCPAFKGIGLSFLFLTIPMLIISNMNSTWSLYYTFISAQSIITGDPLPWSFQDKPRLPNREITGSLIEFFNIASEEANKTKVESKPLIIRNPEMWPTTPDYFHHLYHTAVPEMVMSIDDDMVLRVIDKKIVLGSMQTKMVAFLALAWFIVSLCTIHNSVNTMNRIVYITATLPLLILAILFARVIHLPGAWQGIQLLYPSVQRINEKAVWQNAIKLIFFDMQIGVGVLISISKHNRFHTNVYRDSVLLVIVNMVVNLVCACVSFGFLGFLAYNLGSSDIRAMCRGQTGPHLLWDQILRSMSYLRRNEGPVFCFLYQLMVSLGSIGCSFTLSEYFASALDYKIPWLKNRSCVLRGIVSLFMFTLTLPCCFQSGVHIYNLLVHYSMHWNVKIIALVQFVVISYFYGVDNLFTDIRVMLRLPREECPGIVKRFIGPTGHFIRHSWNWLCPLIIASALALDLIMKSVERAKRVGDSNLWHFISIISTCPLLSFLYYIYNKDKNAFKPNKWRINLQIPIDESIICNSHLTELESLHVVEQGVERIPEILTQILTPAPAYTIEPRPYNNYPVNFVISRPYFSAQTVLNPLLRRDNYESEDDETKNESRNSIKNEEDSSDSVSHISESSRTNSIPNTSNTFPTTRFSQLTGQPAFL